MKYGKVLTYKDIEEAKKLIGKKVIGSNYLDTIERDYEKSIMDEGILTGVCSFFEIDGISEFQFIREVIEEKPKCRPYNWDEAQGILGLIVHKMANTYAYGEQEQYRVVTSVNLKSDGQVQIMGLTAEKFLELYEFTNGKPCGVEVEK